MDPVDPREGPKMWQEWLRSAVCASDRWAIGCDSALPHGILVSLENTRTPFMRLERRDGLFGLKLHTLLLKGRETCKFQNDPRAWGETSQGPGSL